MTMPVLSKWACRIRGCRWVDR